jgi:hypothetical protein
VNDAVTRQRIRVFDAGRWPRKADGTPEEYAQFVSLHGFTDYYALAEEKPGVVLAEWIGFDLP